MNQLVDILAQFDVILLSVMLSGITVKMYGEGRGKTAWSNEWASFYVLFLAFVFENVLIALLANFVLLPFIDQLLITHYTQIFTITAEIILTFNVWFAWTFGYKQRLEMIALLAIATILLFIL